MQVHRIQNNNYNTNFQAVHVSKGQFSGKQGQVSAMLVKKFKEIVPNLESKTLEAQYKKNGYDFIIYPYPHYDLVSLSAFKNLRIRDGKQVSHKGEKYIGTYSLESLSTLGDDLKQKLKV